MSMMTEEELAADAREQTFDRLVGAAALEGTLTVKNLLQLLRPHVTHQEVIDLDTVAHILLEL